MIEGTQYKLTDRRDGKTYCVAKQKDNNIWMTQNLDLDLKSSQILTENDTDINYNGDSGRTEWTPDSNFHDTIDATSGTISGWVTDNSHPYSVDVGDKVIVNGASSESNLADCIATGTPNCSNYHVGNYYNWTAAVAENNTSSKTANYTVMKDSICPKGWRLPNGMTASGTTSDYSELLFQSGIVTARSTTSTDAATYTSDGATKILESPLFLVRSGYVTNNLFNNVGTRDAYWSSTVNTSVSAYSLTFDSLDNTITPQKATTRYVGRTIRCMAR